MKPVVAICFYGEFRPHPRRHLSSVMRCVLSPLFRHLGDEYEKAFFLHATMDSANALPGISMMMNEFPFHEMALSSTTSSLRRVMALLGSSHVFRLVVCIRLDMFFTSPLHISDIHRLFEEDSIFLPEPPMDGKGLVIGSMRTIRLFMRDDDSPTILWTQHQIRCVRISIVMVRLASDGTVVAQDRSRCPYLDDLLASNE